MKKLIFANLLVAMIAPVLLAQTAGANRALVVNGKRVNTGVIQREGRFYVDVEALITALGGIVVLQPNQIAVSVAQQPAGPEPESAESLSREFQRTAILALGDMRQWAGAIGTLITTGYPPTSQWPREYHERVDRDVLEAAAAASTDADHDAFQLLENHYAELAKWADKAIADRKAMNADRFVDPNALQTDKVLPKITRCGQFLSSMMVRGKFADDPSCH